MKKKPLSTGQVISIGLISLLILGVAGIILFSPSNDSEVSGWFKTNFFPSNEYATVSIMDSSIDVSSEEYQGSTSSAWVISFIVAMIVLFAVFIFFAWERGYFE